MSLSTRVIARIDLKPTLGAVKGVRFDGLRKVGDAGELVDAYAAQGADEIFLLDITASLYGRRPHLREILWAAQNTIIPVTYAGGIRRLQDVRNVTAFCPVEKIALNTAALACPKLITEIAHTYGSQSAVVHIDAKWRDGWWEAYTHGGREPSGRDAVAWAMEAADAGAGELILGSVDRDGTGRGLDLALLGKIAPRVNVPLVMTGGAGCVQHVLDAVEAGASAVAVGSLLHRGTSVGELKAALAADGVTVR